jgi:type II secretory pathway pseudopilin PulG
MNTRDGSGYPALRHRGPRARQRLGHSLIELLVVIGIIVILIAALLPALRRSMRQAASAVCMHNLSELNHALQMYRYDNRGWLPNVTPLPSTSPSEPDSAWFPKLMPRYFADPGVLLCPSDPFRRLARASLPPSPQPDFANACSYGMSDFILGSPRGYLANREPPHPLSTLLLADIGPDDNELLIGTQTTVLTLGEIRAAGHLSIDDGFRPGAMRAKGSWITARHNGAIHMLTVGGSVVPVRTERVMNTIVQPFYENCSAGGCTICRVLALPHYSFAHGSLYWWTGPVPRP